MNWTMEKVNVPVVALGLGRSSIQGNGHSGDELSYGSSTYFDDFALSETIIFLCVVGIVLAAASCIGCLVFHCCPSWIPTKIRKIRDCLHPSGAKHTGYNCNGNSCHQITIPVVIISDDTGIVDPPLYQPAESKFEMEELAIQISSNSKSSSSSADEKLM